MSAKRILSAIFDYRVSRVLAGLWMALIFWLSSLPDVPGPNLFSAQDKLEHFLVFGILGFLLASALGPWKRRPTWREIAFATSIVAAYGAFDELHQMFVSGRTASLFDLFFDSLGGFCFVCLYRRFFPYLQTAGSQSRNPTC